MFPHSVLRAAIFFKKASTGASSAFLLTSSAFAGKTAWHKIEEESRLTLEGSTELGPVSEIPLEDISMIKSDDVSKSSAALEDDISSLGSFLDCESSIEWVPYNMDLILEPASEHEAESVLQEIRTIPTVQKAVANLSETQINILCNEVVKLACSTTFVDKVKARIENGQPPKNSVNVKSEAEEWEALASSYKCIFCQDLMAAPMVVKCGHTFCYHCLEEYSDQCRAVDDDLEVVCKCPNCKEYLDAKTATIVLSLSDWIDEQVQRFSDDVKADWKVRRQTYTDARRRQIELEKNKKAERDLLISQAEENENNHSLGDWEMFCKNMVPYLAFMVIIVLGVMKRK